MGVLFALGGGVCGNLDYAGAGGAAGIVTDRSSRFSACDNHIVELFGFIESRNGVFGNKSFLLRGECFVAVASVFNRFAAVLGHRLEPCNLVLNGFCRRFVRSFLYKAGIFGFRCFEVILGFGLEEFSLCGSEFVKCLSCSFDSIAAFEGNGSELRNRFVNGFCRCVVRVMLYKARLLGLLYS